VPATPANPITPRRAIKNYQIKGLINLRYVALDPDLPAVLHCQACWITLFYEDRSIYEQLGR
jgi:hypothetical protein